MMKSIYNLVAIVAVLLPCLCFAKPEQIVNTTLCELSAYPAKFNHKLVKLSGNVTHGYRLFSFTDDGCQPNLSSIWLDYGGSVMAPSVYNPQHENEHRNQPLVIEGVPTTLVEDAQFKKFSDMIAGMSDKPQARVTLIGRYFAGHEVHVAGFDLWKGFGPLDCCTLLVIQKIVDVKQK